MLGEWVHCQGLVLELDLGAPIRKPESVSVMGCPSSRFLHLLTNTPYPQPWPSLEGRGGLGSHKR